MGRVYLAEQREPLVRRVALKLIKPGMDTREVLDRFELERHVLSLMDHPGIARVLDAGLGPDQRPYFVMEYVPGMPINDYCDYHRLRNAERLAIFLQVCAAVQHAHQKGIIHRDIKPQNILVSVQAGKPVPKVIDFGIAKATRHTEVAYAAFTRLGMLIGTPEYMSPEQAESTGLELDTTTDIYSLGVVLYELLTGVLPFDGEMLRRAGYAEMQRILRDEDPPRPSARVTALGATASDAARRRQTTPPGLGRQLHGDLDSIAMKALEKDRARRYASASEMAADIQRHLDDHPVLAGRPSLAYIAKKFVRRHRRPVAAALVVLTTLVAGLVGTSLMYVNASRANVRAEQERGESVRQSYIANIVAADSSLRMHEVAEAKRRLAACDPKLRNWEWRHLSREADSSIAEFRDTGNVPVRAWFVPDGSHILVLAGWTDQLSPTQNALLKWDPAGRTSAVRQDQEMADAVTAGGERVTDGSRVLEASSHRVVCVLDWEHAPGARKKLETAFRTPVAPNASAGVKARAKLHALDDLHQAVAFSGDGALLATGEGGGLALNPFFGSDLFPGPPGGPIRVWDAGSGQLRETLTGHRATIWALAFSPDQERLASASEDGTARVWNLSTGSAVATLNGHASGVVAVAFSRDGTRVATGSRDQTVRVWNAGTGALIQTMTGHGERVTSVGFSPDGRTVASGSADKTVRVWDVESGRETGCLFGHEAGVLSVAFSPDGDRIVSGAVDGSVRLWKPAPAGPLDTIVRTQRKLGLVHLAHSQAGTAIAANEMFRITTWDGSSGQRVAEINAPGPTNFWSVSMNGDGSRLVGGTVNYGVRVFDARSGEQIAVLGDPRRLRVRAVAYRPDSGRIAASDEDRLSVGLWDASSFKRLLLLKGHSKEVIALTYSPDGRMLASGDQEGTVRLWDDASGRALQVLAGHTGEVRSLAFSRDGSSLASAARDGTARVWNTQSGRLIAVLRGHDGQSVASASFSPDGSRVVTAAGDKTVRVWDAKAGDQLLVLRYRNAIPSGAMFTPDGDRIVSWSARRDIHTEPRVIWSAK